MPELPEVETTRRGLAPHVVGATVTRVEVREARLRWPVPASLPENLVANRIEALERRAKYLLFRTKSGSAIVHLGMSGSLRLVRPGTAFRKHDHIEIVFDNDWCARFHDPRRFGSFLWTDDDPLKHPLLEPLGPEPLSGEFNADYLYGASRKRSVSVKNLLMNSLIVVGVGNIYANEALYRAGIHPRRAAGRISVARYGKLADETKKVLSEAIEDGGTTLRDFVSGDGEPGYFAQHLDVYGREDEPCRRCGKTIRATVIGQRTSYYCPGCQR